VFTSTPSAAATTDAPAAASMVRGPTDTRRRRGGADAEEEDRPGPLPSPVRCPEDEELESAMIGKRTGGAGAWDFYAVGTIEDSSSLWIRSDATDLDQMMMISHRPPLLAMINRSRQPPPICNRSATDYPLSVKLWSV